MFDTLPQNAHGITRRPTLDHAVCLFVFVVVVVFFLFCFSMKLSSHVGCQPSGVKKW